MSDPQPDRLNSKPPRAEPLQPDRPNQGDAKQPNPEDHQKDVRDAALEKQREQTDTALDNVRKGYD